MQHPTISHAMKEDFDKTENPEFIILKEESSTKQKITNKNVSL